MREQSLVRIHRGAVDVESPLRVAFHRTIGPAWFNRLAQRFVRWAITRLDANYIESRAVVTFSVPDGQTLMERVRLNQRDLMAVFERRAAFLLVGPQILNELHADRDPFSYQAHVQVGSRNVLRVVGIEVVYVPWMEGCLLVPEWR